MSSAISAGWPKPRETWATAGDAKVARIRHRRLGLVHFRLDDEPGGQSMPIDAFVRVFVRAPHLDRPLENRGGPGGRRPGSGTPVNEAAQAVFLGAFAATLSVAESARMAGVSRSGVHLWREDPAFEARYQAARTEAFERLEAEGFRRALDGRARVKFNPKTGEPYMVRNPVSGEMEPYVEYEASDQLWLALMRANDPRYVERKELTGAAGGPVAFRLMAEMADDELDRAIAEIEGGAAAPALPAPSGRVLPAGAGRGTVGGDAG